MHRFRGKNKVLDMLRVCATVSRDDKRQNILWAESSEQSSGLEKASGYVKARVTLKAADEVSWGS